MIDTLHKITNALKNRLARNIYLWAFLIFFVIDTNNNNEKFYHYHIIESSWYWWIIVIGTLLQLCLLYTNNLVLIPKLLVRKKRLKYVLSVFVLVTVISIIYTIGLKIAKAHIDIDHLQQIGFVSSPITTDWDWSSIRSESESYFAGNILWILVFSMAWYMNDYARQRKALDASEKKRVETELHFLKSQINPHFLFNTLNNIYGLSLKKAETTPDVILKLSSILRYLLYDSNIQLVPFEKEKEIMQAYIDLELLRLPENGDFRFRIEADKHYSIPALIWLPVLENVFKHATRVITDKYLIDYGFTIKEGTLLIWSRNNYKAIFKKDDEQAGGIDLPNLHKRLELLYPGRHSVMTRQEEDTFITEVKIQLV